MKKETYSIYLLIVTIIMLCFVFLIAKHYKSEVKELDKRIKKLEIKIEEDGKRIHG